MGLPRASFHILPEWLCTSITDRLLLYSNIFFVFIKSYYSYNDEFMDWNVCGLWVCLSMIIISSVTGRQNEWPKCRIRCDYCLNQTIQVLWRRSWMNWERPLLYSNQNFPEDGWDIFLSLDIPEQQDNPIAVDALSWSLVLVSCDPVIPKANSLDIIRN